MNKEARRILKDRRTKKRTSREGLVGRIFQIQKKTSKRRGHFPPVYTVKEFRDWVLSRPNFESLYSEWVASGYDKWKRPSTDRLNDNIGYSFANIQLVTWEYNYKKQLEKTKKPVHMYTMSGEYVNTIKSITDAAAKVDGDVSAITNACAGNISYAYDHQWRYSQDGVEPPKRIIKATYNGSDRKKPVSQYDKTGKYLKTFDSAAAAGLDIGVNGSAITDACKGNVKSCGGYQWSYEGMLLSFGKGSFGVDKYKDNKTVAVAQYTLGGDYLKTFDSMTDAARSVNGHKSNIFSVVRGITPTTNGFRWVSVEKGIVPDKNIGPLIRNASKMKKVYQYEMDGAYVASHNSISAAKNSLGVKSTHISKVIAGKRASSNGYKWSDIKTDKYKKTKES